MGREEKELDVLENGNRRGKNRKNVVVGGRKKRKKSEIEKEKRTVSFCLILSLIG